MVENELALPCVDKMAFDSERQALDTALTSKHWYGSKLKAYLCKYCHLWHLASIQHED